MVKILEGRSARDEILQRLQETIAQEQLSPKLVIIQVGDDPASNAYIKQKKLFGEKIGAEVVHVQLAETISQGDLEKEIAKHNGDGSVNGIIIQLPLPAPLSATNLTAPTKDVDNPAPVAQAVLKLLDYHQVPVAGRRVLVIGRSTLVGQPIALALLARSATVTIAHRQSGDITKLISEAEIIISATGTPRLFDDQATQVEQIIIDVGITRTEAGLAGDVDEQTKQTVAAASPVPGGVGPLTVASLFDNLVTTCVKQKKRIK